MPPEKQHVDAFDKFAVDLDAGMILGVSPEREIVKAPILEPCPEDLRLRLGDQLHVIKLG